MISVASIAVERFGGIVSSLGHRAGDEVIRLTAGVLRNRDADGQIVGHSNGAEFLALPGYDAHEATQWVEYLADQLRAGVRFGGANVSLQATAGSSVTRSKAADAAEPCRRASTARGEALERHEAVGIYRLARTIARCSK